jgi:hypothetical protein
VLLLRFFDASGVESGQASQIRHIPRAQSLPQVLRNRRVSKFLNRDSLFGGCLLSPIRDSRIRTPESRNFRSRTPRSAIQPGGPRATICWQQIPQYYSIRNTRGSFPFSTWRRRQGKKDILDIHDNSLRRMRVATALQ